MLFYQYSLRRVAFAMQLKTLVTTQRDKTSEINLANYNFIGVKSGIANATWLEVVPTK